MTPTMIDVQALRFNQMSIVVLVLTGFIFDVRIIPAIVALILLAGAIRPSLSVFRLIYAQVIVPAGLLTPRVVEDNGLAHRFAQLLGGLMLAIASVAFLFEDAYTGWLLSWVVALLAGVNLAFGFCVGCFLYYRIQRMRTGRLTTHSPEA